MRKKQDRVDMEYQKPTVKFIEQFRNRVATNYPNEEQIIKKLKINEEDDPQPIIVNESELPEQPKFDIHNFKPQFKKKLEQNQINQSKQDDKEKIKNNEKKKDNEIKKDNEKQPIQQTKQQNKKSIVSEIIKKNNKPTVLSFDQDDI